MKPTPSDWPRCSSSIFYRNAATAIDWLCDAFGFEVRLKVESDDGRIEHSELTYGEGLIMVSQEDAESDRPWKRMMRSPQSLAGATTQSIMFFVDDADAHCAHARCAWRAHRRGAGNARLRRGLLGRPQLRRDRSRGSLLVGHAKTPQSAGEMSACPSFGT